MKILEQKDKEEYENLMDEVSVVLFKHSLKSISDLSDVNIEPSMDNIHEIEMAVGQPCLDKVIELTEKMDRDKILRFLTEILTAHSTSVMVAHPDYQKKIMMKLILLGK